MKQQSGFTLVEMMVTIAILAILMGIAAPAVTDFAIKQRVSSQANEMMLSLAFARSEAVKLNQDVRVIPRTSTANGWSDGWCVGPANIGSDCNHADVIRVFTGAGGVSITSSGISNPPALVFLRDGTASNSVDALLKVSSPNLEPAGDTARCIRLTRPGRAEVEKVARDAAC